MDLLRVKIEEASEGLSPFGTTSHPQTQYEVGVQIAKVNFALEVCISEKCEL
jgi:hypothetical protein